MSIRKIVAILTDESFDMYVSDEIIKIGDICYDVHAKNGDIYSIKFNVNNETIEDTVAYIEILEHGVGLFNIHKRSLRTFAFNDPEFSKYPHYIIYYDGDNKSIISSDIGLYDLKKGNSFTANFGNNYGQSWSVRTITSVLDVHQVIKAKNSIMYCGEHLGQVVKITFDNEKKPILVSINHYHYPVIIYN